MQHCFFWVHATVSFFSSLADVAGATVLYSWKRRWYGVEVEESGTSNLKWTSWACVHHGTTYKAHRCKRRHPSQDQVFDCLIVVRKPLSSGSHRTLCPDTVNLTQSSLPLVVFSDGIVPTIHLQKQESIEILKSSHQGDVCTSFKLKKT